MENIFNEEFWVAVCFVIFIILAYRPVKKAIFNALDARIDVIKKQITEAKDLRNEAEALLREAKKEISNFEDYKQAVMQDAKASTAKIVDMRTKEMENKLIRQKESAHQSIISKGEEVSGKLSQEFTDKVILIVENYLRDNKNQVISADDILLQLSNK